MFLSSTYPFQLPPLPYAYDALEPYIDTETMYLHHDRHFQTYIQNLNAVLAKHPQLQNRTLEQLLTLPGALPAEDATALHNNAGGTYNHYLFFEGLAPAAEPVHNLPCGVLNTKITNAFGSWDAFRRAFSTQAAAVFGSGYACLMEAPNGALSIIKLANQDTVLQYGGRSLLLLDVWEHAYYLKYHNLRKDYIAMAWNVLYIFCK